jgi:predicted short-subunit dehydrogenase-like oxidoreductase (DUF2520 family)
MRRVSIIGAGVVGTALGYLLNKGGFPVVGIASRTLRSAEKAREFIGSGQTSIDLSSTARKAEIVFLTTSDRAIKGACDHIAFEGGFNPGAVVFHTCGALPSTILKSARKCGAETASLHPLQSFANVKKAVKNLPGSYFCIEGDESAISVAREIIAVLRGKEITLNVYKKPFYHAGACAASNFLVATVGFGLELFEAAGIERHDALKALMPLIKGTVKNIETLGIPLALTGPIARGDRDVIEDHLKIVLKERPELVKIYTELGRYTAKVAVKKGTLKDKTARSIISLFDKYEKRLSV